MILFSGILLNRLDWKPTATERVCTRDGRAEVLS